MFKRQSLQAIGSATPTCSTSSVRVANGARYASQIRLPNRQGSEGKGGNPTSTNPPSEQTSNPANNNNSSAGRSRHQKAAQVSEEVRMLNRSSPSGARTPPSNPPHPSTQRSKGVDAQAVYGRNPGGQMGRNVNASRDGPNSASQGPGGRSFRAGAARGGRPAGGFAARGGGGRRGGGADNRANPDQEGADADENDSSGLQAPSTQHELILLEQFDKQDITAVPFEPEAVTKETYLNLGQGGATIAAGNYAGVLEDRLTLLAEPSQDGFRWAPHIAHRMLQGEFVSFKSEEEKSAVVASAQHLGSSGLPKSERTFSPVSEASQRVLVDKLVRGVYTDPKKAGGNKQAVLDDIVRNTLRNPTYLADDQSKLLRKIRSLLPSEAAASAAKKPAAPKAARK
ncbi:hypothetical protein AAFC00_000974 [Neodothiora populina]|uniref:Uncharacterized protein n=1 Tax=Neodothiora populina TaxID=2781224 RepID=A0ABR3PMR7_9PEZI